MTAAPRRPLGQYDPWHDLAVNWPEVDVRIEPMTGTLLGVLAYPVILLRAGTSAAQRRCTLTHEIVHLERGIDDCGPWHEREEQQVHREVARRLIPVEALVAAVRSLGPGVDLGQLAQALDVDRETARIRLDLQSLAQRAQLDAALSDAGWRTA
ncbi:MAG: hypothetical protein QOH89_696 [Pseudonocardiales bacterium]|nr:hypothetical protein [Pseudonocardiales bacterium]